MDSRTYAEVVKNINRYVAGQHRYAEPVNPYHDAQIDLHNRQHRYAQILQGTYEQENFPPEGYESWEHFNLVQECLNLLLTEL